MALIDDIATYLEDEGVGFVGQSIFKSYMPDWNGGTMVSIMDTGGTVPDKYLPTHEPTFQVFIRSNDYDTGKTMLELIRSTLHRLTNATIGDTYVYFILAMAEGGHIGRNESGQDEFSINFRCRTR